MPNCNVAGDVIVGADGISGYMSLLASLYGGGEVVKCVVSNDWDFGLNAFELLYNLAVVVVVV